MSSEPRASEALLRRLLGPAGAELTCEQCFEQIDRYAEAELDHGTARADELVPGMSAHLQGCQACDEEHRSLRALLERERPA